MATEQQRLLKRGRKLKGASPEQRHRVRIAAKRARYAAEFFASLYPARRVRPYVAALMALQRGLGSLNDGDVALRLLDDLSEGQDGLQDGAALVRAYLAGRGPYSEPEVRRLWKNLPPLDKPD